MTSISEEEETKLAGRPNILTSSGFSPMSLRAERKNCFDGFPITSASTPQANLEEKMSVE